MKIPSNKQWTQDNSGDTFGIVGDSKNMVFDTAGKAKLARKAVFMNGSNLDGDFGYPLAITYYDNSYVVLTDDAIFQASLPALTFAQLTWPPTTFLGSDAVVFNSLYTFTITNDIYTWNGGTLSGDVVDRNVSLTSGIPHPLSVFGTLCAVGDGNLVKLFNTSYVVTQTLTLPTAFRVTTIRSVGDYLYIGTRNLNSGNAKIFIWDGDSTLFNYECEVGANWVFSMTPYLSTVAAITSQGQLGVVNGTTFQELASLPVYSDPHARWQGSTGLQLNGKVFNRGMVTLGDSIYMNIEGDVDSYFIPKMKSGIWVYDPQVGLYHRATSGYDRRISDTGLSRSGDILTTSATHGLKKGDAVSFSTVSGLSGVDSNRLYYVDPVASNQIKLAASRKGLQAGNYVTLSGTPTAGDALVYTQNSDAGVHEATSGALSLPVPDETPNSQYTSEILWGARIETVGGTVRYGIFSFADSLNIGTFTTQRIYSDNERQHWDDLKNFIDGFIVDSEEVVVKAQNKYQEEQVELQAVWLNTNTINNANAEDYASFLDIDDGDEIVFIDGYGRGYSAHVIEKNVSSSTVSLILDENIGTANESCTIYATNFKKIGQTLTIDNKDFETLDSKVSLTMKPSPWIRFKIELRGFGIAVNMLDLENAKSK